jgi:hypothetical protein
MFHEPTLGIDVLRVLSLLKKCLSLFHGCFTSVFKELLCLKYELVFILLKECFTSQAFTRRLLFANRLRMFE